MGIKLESWHKLTVCGMNGTGKTWLEKFGLLPTYKRILIFDTDGEFAEYPTIEEAKESKSKKPILKVRYEPSTDSPRELDKIAKAVYEKGNYALLVSEAEIYLPVNRPIPTNLFKLITRGRRRNCGVIFDTRRIANLNKTAFGLSDHCFIFRHFSPTDLDYLKGFIPQDVRGLQSLGDYWFWHYTRGKVEVCSPIKVPRETKR